MYYSVLSCVLLLALSSTSAESDVESSEQLEELYKICREAGVSEPDRLTASVVQQVQQCFNKHLRLSELPAEMTNFSSHGALDELFHRRCDDMPDVIDKCAVPALEQLAPCFNNDNITAETFVNVTVSVISRAVEFLCYNDGERMAIFLSVSGPECVQQNSTRDTAVECLKNIDHHAGVESGNVSLTVPLVQSLLVGDVQSCGQLAAAHKCVVRGLETCQDSTTSQLADSLLKVIRDTLPCPQKQVSASAMFSGSLLVTILMMFFVLS